MALWKLCSRFFLPESLRATSIEHYRHVVDTDVESYFRRNLRIVFFGMVLFLPPMYLADRPLNPLAIWPVLIELSSLFLRLLIPAAALCCLFLMTKDFFALEKHPQKREFIVKRATFYTLAVYALGVLGDVWQNVRLSALQTLPDVFALMVLPIMQFGLRLSVRQMIPAYVLHIIVRVGLEYHAGVSFENASVTGYMTVFLAIFIYIVGRFNEHRVRINRLEYQLLLSTQRRSLGKAATRVSHVVNNAMQHIICISEAAFESKQAFSQEDLEEVTKQLDHVRIELNPFFAFRRYGKNADANDGDFMSVEEPSNVKPRS